MSKKRRKFNFELVPTAGRYLGKAALKTVEASYFDLIKKNRLSEIVWRCYGIEVDQPSYFQNLPPSVAIQLTLYRKMLPYR